MKVGRAAGLDENVVECLRTTADICCTLPVCSIRKGVITVRPHEGSWWY